MHRHNSHVHRARLVILAVLAAFIVAVLPAAAAGNDWGTWTFSGHGTSWSGTFVDAHNVTGVVMGLKSLPRYNGLTYFKIGRHTCKLASNHGDAYCYNINIPANKKLSWSATTRRNVASSEGLVPCIQYNRKFHCRYGNG